ncbi:unnamed protein product [Arabis nemorensis]|uniref:Neprosin PEP catalytic domain-containing protein n=1 Tax=Arabis nemorensis TaxID=586526 RepID=A0A565CU89_9BRAS|nr:unnamed protein product [Arabis nemorensis]
MLNGSGSSRGRGQYYIGAISHINVWNPSGVQAADYTSAQIWLLGELSDVFESKEAGWMVNPKVFGDNCTRLFTYWTVKRCIQENRLFRPLMLRLRANKYSFIPTLHDQYDMTDTGTGG